MSVRHTTVTGAAASLAALGVVFGDIGTSPLYALRAVIGETGAGDERLVYGVTSLLIWSLGLVVTVLYVSILMRHDNDGEGGLLSLFGLIRRAQPNKKLAGVAIVIAVIGAATFLGDSMITPAISVLSAVEGISELSPRWHSAIVPVTVAILLGVFAVQRFGTERIGRVFGPLMLLWFTVITVLGVLSIALTPGVLVALSPHWIVLLFLAHPWTAFLSLGSVVLAITGAEALFADMGHFGRKPIAHAWLLVVFPALIVTYLGQAASVVREPDATGSPIYAMVPGWAMVPMILLATVATVIAAQAVISGAFSVVKQAGRLGLLPRLRVIHTSGKALGQIYVPAVNVLLLLGTVGLVLTFRSSAALSSAYGLAVIITMAMSTLMLLLVLRARHRWATLQGVVTWAMLGVIAMFLLASAPKILTGGWFPIGAGAVLVVLMWTWHRGLDRLDLARRRSELPLDEFLRRSRHSPRLPGTTVFLARSSDVAPGSLRALWEQSGVVASDLVIVAVHGSNAPFDCTVTTRTVAEGVTAVDARIGFMRSPNVLTILDAAGERFRGERGRTIRFVVSSNTPVTSEDSPLPMWQQRLFGGLERLRPAPPEVHGLPLDRTVIIGRELSL